MIARRKYACYHTYSGKSVNRRGSSACHPFASLPRYGDIERQGGRVPMKISILDDYHDTLRTLKCYEIGP